MELTKTEQEMLAGKNGKGTQKCMKLLVTMGEVTGAKKMVPIVSGHIAGNYAVMGDEGIEWVEEIGRDGARLKIYTTKNPEMFDFDNPQELGVPVRVQNIQNRMNAALKTLGVTLTYTCHHYLAGNVPRFGDHIAWASSGSLCFANSVIGARSNRDGDHVVISAAVTGVIPETGLHLTENRKAQVLVSTKNLPLSTFNYAEWQALGYKLGKLVAAKIPAFIDLPQEYMPFSNIRALFYSLTTTGAMPMIHLVGITPEAPTLEAACGGSSKGLDVISITEEDVRQAYREASSAKTNKVDLVIFGCPQCSIQEMTEAVDMLDGKKVAPNTELWFCTSAWVKTLCKRMGYEDRIKAAGGRIVADVGAGDGPFIYLKERGIKTMAINSVRGSYYASNLFGMGTWFGTTEECLKSAIAGTWQGRV
jgi:predicted aconitase